MGNNNAHTPLLGFWLVLFIAAKFAGPCAAWSWWWMLAPPIPLLTELIKFIIAR